MKTPEISVLQAQKETALFAQRIQSMFGMVRQLVDEKDKDKAEDLFTRIEKFEDASDSMEMQIANYLEKVSDAHLSDETKEKIRQMLRAISEIESIGDSCYKLARTLHRRQESGTDYTNNQYVQMKGILVLLDEALTHMNIIMKGRREEQDINETYRIENDINAMRNKLKMENIRAVDEHQYDYALGTMFIDFISECEKLGDYVVNVVEARFGR